MKEIELPGSFICPISQVEMKDPVINAAGQTYDRGHITTWYSTNNRDPLTGKELSPAEKAILIPNFALKSAIDEFNKQAKQIQALEQQSKDLIGQLALKNELIRLQDKGQGEVELKTSSEVLANIQKQLARPAPGQALLNLMSMQTQEIREHQIALAATQVSYAIKKVAYKNLLHKLVALKKQCKQEQKRITSEYKEKYESARRGCLEATREQEIDFEKIGVMQKNISIYKKELDIEQKKLAQTKLELSEVRKKFKHRQSSLDKSRNVIEKNKETIHQTSLRRNDCHRQTQQVLECEDASIREMHSSMKMSLWKAPSKEKLQEDLRKALLDKDSKEVQRLLTHRRLDIPGKDKHDLCSIALTNQDALSFVALFNAWQIDSRLQIQYVTFREKKQASAPFLSALIRINCRRDLLLPIIEKAHPDMLNALDSRGETALHWAVYAGLADICERLLAHPLIDKHKRSLSGRAPIDELSSSRVAPNVAEKIRQMFLTPAPSAPSF